MRRWGMLTLVLCALAPAAWGQADEGNFRLWLGSLSPERGASQRLLGVSWDLPAREASPAVRHSLYADNTLRGSDTSLLLGVGILSRRFLPAGAGVRPYLGLGVGVYNIDLAPGRLGPTRPGARLEVGVVLPGGPMLAVDYTAVQSVQGARPGGVGVRLGFSL